MEQSGSEGTRADLLSRSWQIEGVAASAMDLRRGVSNERADQAIYIKDEPGKV